MMGIGIPINHSRMERMTTVSFSPADGKMLRLLGRS
jgi:hypothetical protein